MHCGFCLATCPTYLDTRDERDSPRGRIYLLRDFLEQGRSDTVAQHHLDRCLTCLSCETTCPSGVRYGVIADAGRALLEEALPRSPVQRLLRRGLRAVVPYPARFGTLLRIGQALLPLLPRRLRQHVPPRPRLPPPPPPRAHARRVLLLEGCVQRAATPDTNRALRRILDRLGIGVMESPGQGCCGALDTHLGATTAGLVAMRRNVDAWWPAIESGATAILSSATGCGSLIADYGARLAHDPAYAQRAARVSALACDAASFLGDADCRQRLAECLAERGPAGDAGRIAVHVPCSQQHAMGQPDAVRELMQSLGFTLAQTRDDHLCCGSAGTYSLLQPAMSRRLRERKISALCGDEPALIATANVGCQLHLAQAAGPPVRHWLDVLAASLK